MPYLGRGRYEWGVPRERYKAFLKASFDEADKRGISMWAMNGRYRVYGDRFPPDYEALLEEVAERFKAAEPAHD